MKILQAGNKVSADTKGRRTSSPRSEAEAASMVHPRRTLPVMGSANPRNEAAREAAGMKDGGLVRMTPKSSRKC